MEGHPQSLLYKLLIGPHTGVCDRINAAYTVVDFFLMDFGRWGEFSASSRSGRRDLSRTGWRGKDSCGQRDGWS